MSEHAAVLDARPVRPALDVAEFARTPTLREDGASLKVLHVVDNFSAGGAAMGVLNLIRATADRAKHAVLSLAPGVGMADQLPAGTPVRALQPGRRNGLLGFVARLVNWVRRENFDVLHVNNLGAWLDVAVAARLTGRPCVETFHGLECLVEELSASLRWKSYLAARMTSVTAVGDASRDTVCRLGGLATDAVQVIRNGIDLERHQPLDTHRSLRKAVRTEFGVAADVPLAVHVAGLRPVKDQLTLLKAWWLVVAQSRDRTPVLLLIGDGPCRQSLTSIAQELGIADAVRFLGQREDVETILPACDAFVLSSLTEGLSLAILEAMACGLPVVATDVGGNRELVRDGLTGRLVPSGDAEKLAHALIETFSNPERAQRMGQAARSRVEADYDLEKMASRYVDLYSRLRAQSRRGRPSPLLRKESR
jgi:glycosyltransferase involved in cell wall biosynthesis